MKRTFLLLLAGAGLFASGYFLRDMSPDAGRAAGESRPRAASVRPHSTAGPGTADRPAAGRDAALRPFVPGRPFARGHAREWLLDLAAGLSGDRRGKAIAFAGIFQSFVTMDDDAVRETLASLEELIAIEDARNPERRRNPNGDGKLDAMLEFALMRLVQTQPEEALAILQKNWSLNDGSTRLLVLGGLAAGDPQRAEQLAQGMEKERQKDMMEALLYALINKQPQAALDLAARHPEISSEMYRERILEAWAQRDPAAAMAAAMKEMAASNNPDLVRKTIEDWGKRDPAAAAQWAAAYEGPGRIIARAAMLDRRAREEPGAVLAEYAALQQAGGDPRELYRLTSTLADSFARTDLEAARTWAGNLPDGELRRRALQPVTAEWVKHDAPAASEWIKAQPPGEIRDFSAKELSAAIARSDPARAFEWARDIQNAKLRQGALETVIKQWHETDPEAAKAATESLPAENRPQ